MPIKNRQSKILLCLFMIGNDSDPYVEITQTMQNIFDIHLNQKTKGTLSALIKDDAIEKSDQIDRSYRLKDRGADKLFLEFPFFRFLSEDWDGLWRIISYEIPESKRELRDKLRREMRGWGLGPWHRSFWLTPHPIISALQELVYGKEEETYIQAFEATHIFGDRENLVEKVWEKSRLEEKYRQLFKHWHGILSQEKDNETKIREVVVSYVEVLRDDPGLPSSLMGKKWIGYEAFDIFKEIKGILLKQ